LTGRWIDARVWTSPDTEEHREFVVALSLLRGGVGIVVLPGMGLQRVQAIVQPGTAERSGTTARFGVELPSNDGRIELAFDLNQSKEAACFGWSPSGGSRPTTSD
jgi:hypothetical protein